jgi:hypothetical protein
MGNKAAVDRLDEVVVEPAGGKLVADAPAGTAKASEVVDGNGDPPWTRTMNPEIKSPFSTLFRRVARRLNLPPTLQVITV